ncbi:hypothetical protein AUP68_07783 [Ilyonectria robusta]
MHFSLLSVLSFVALAEAQWQSCAKPWAPGIKPGESFTIKAQCHLFPGYPKRFGKTKVTASYTEKWIASGARPEQVAAVLEQTLDDSITKYSEFATLPKEVVVIVTPAVDGTTLAETIYPEQMKSPCQIQTFKQWSHEAAGADVPRALQAIAHELYHCIQLLELGDVQNPHWVLDGSANYFSNVVYPATNLEWPKNGFGYKPSSPIYAQPGLDAYGTSIFFQSLEATKGLDYINEWVMVTDPTPAKLERRRLSELPSFTDLFLLFAKQYSLESIIDTSGVPIPGLPKIEPTSAKVTFNKAGTTGTATLKVVPFTIRVFKLTLKAGHLAVIYSAADSEQRLAYRDPSNSEWTKMPSGPPSGSAGEVDCHDPGSTQTILVLFVSTADAKSDTVKITIKRQPKKKCKKKGPGGFVLYPLFNEKTSGAVCPKGTHFSSVAAWCCPEGMELDLTVASEVSICCPTSEAQYENITELDYVAIFCIGNRAKANIGSLDLRRGAAGFALERGRR